MNLGRHCPITRVLREGIIRVGQKVMQKLSQEPVDEWFSQGMSYVAHVFIVCLSQLVTKLRDDISFFLFPITDDSPETARMKLIAQVCKYHLGEIMCSASFHYASIFLSDGMRLIEGGRLFILSVFSVLLFRAVCL